MKKILFIAFLLSSILNLKAQQIIGGGLSYKIAFLDGDAFSTAINQTSLHGFYQIQNLTEIGEREVYVGAEISIPTKFKVNYNSDSLYKRLFQFTISLKSIHYLTGDEESKISLHHYYQVAIPLTYIGTKNGYNAPTFLKYDDGFHVGATFEYGAGLRLYINSSLSIYPSLGLNLGVLSFGGLINDEKSIMPYGNLNFLIKGIYTLDN